MILPTVDSLQEQIKAGIQARRESLTDFNEGSVLDAFSHGAAIAAEEVIRVLMRLQSALFFSTDDEDELDSLVNDRFQGNVKRQVATAAYGPVRFSRPDTSAGNVLIRANTQVLPSSAPQLVYVVSTDVLMTDLDVDAVVTCVETGSIGNLAVGLLDTVLTVLDDSTITVSNLERMVGGAERQSNDDVRAIIRAYYPNLSKGVRAALQLGALKTPGVGVKVAFVDESHIAADRGGYVELFVGDSDGQCNDTMLSMVTEDMDNWRAAGVMVRVSGVTRIELKIRMELTLSEPVALGIVAGDIQTTVELYGNSLGAGETVFVSQLQRVAINTSPFDRGGYIKAARAIIYSIEGVPFAGDLVLEAGVLARIPAAQVVVVEAI